MERDVYVLDHFVYQIQIGNIAQMTFPKWQLQTYYSFGLDKRNRLPDQCFRCPYYRLCYGECPKHRFLTTRDGQQGLNALCEGYKHFFAYTESWFLKMAKSLERDDL